MKTREEKITEAIVQDGFEYKGKFYKSLSTRMLLLFERFKSPQYYGGDQLRGLLDYLFVSSYSDSKLLQRITIDEFDDLVYEYADSITSEDLTELGKLFTKFNENAQSTVVDVREDSDKKK